MKNVTYSLVAATLLFAGTSSVAFADPFNYPDSPTTPQPFTVTCDPYTSAFVDGASYMPATNGTCIFTIPQTATYKAVGIYKGTVGSSSIVNIGFTISNPASTLNDTGYNYSNAQLGDDYFAVAFSSDNFSDILSTDAYLRTGAGLPTSDLTTVAWKWGPSGCTQNCNDNVMFLPGIEGSRLYDTDNGGTKLWESDDAGAQQLAMKPDGTSQRGDVYTRDVIGNTSISLSSSINIPITVYQPFIDNLNNMKSSGTIADWEAIPYDWRNSLDQILASGKKIGADGSISYLAGTSSPYIIQELKKLAATSRTGKVTIIAHSNGGLLAKKLTEVLGTTTAAQLIDKIVFVAVPSIGTPRAVEAILSGQDEVIPTHLNAATARYLAQNTPMSYNLLPSNNYLTYVDDPVISFDPSTMQDWITKYGVTGIHSTDRLTAFMLDQAHALPSVSDTDLDTPVRANSTLFNTAIQTHADLDTWTPPPGVQLYEIAGWGNDTLSGITYKRETQIVCTQTNSVGICKAYQKLPPKLTFDTTHAIDGDGTVVEPSALWTNGASSTLYWMNLRTVGLSHFNIFNSQSLIDLTTNLITGSNSPTPIITTSVPLSSDVRRLHFTLHSPLTLGFTDSNGNYTGATATTSQFNIPDVDYEKYGDVQWLSIPQAMAGQVVMHGVANGSFTLDIDQTTGNTVVATTSFEGVPSATSTIATVTVNPAFPVTSNGILSIDFNGDGIIDSTLAANQGSIVLPDLTAPEAIISVSTSTKDVAVTGFDDQSLTAVTKTATTTTITDASGNKTTLYFQKTFSNSLLTYARLTGINYGTSTISLPTSFLYVWDASKILVSQTVIADNTFAIEALYNKTLNKTTIIVLKKNVPIQSTTVSGLAVVKLTTSKGAVNYSW